MEIFEKTIQFAREVIAESKKVYWPSKDQVSKATLVVVVVVFFIGLFMAGADYLYALIFRLLEG